MTGANSRQVALENLREFQEMSYSDVYNLIREKRFEEAKFKYNAVYETMGVEDFNAALSLNITTPHDHLLECMSEMAGKVSEPEKIRAVGFDLSAHVIYNDSNGRLSQGIEVSLYSEDVYDFVNASDALITLQCEAAASEWQGAFMDIESCALDGLGALAQQFANYEQHQNNFQGIIENENGSVIVDPMSIARHVAKLLLAIEYHRYMAEFVSEVEVPSDMVFIIGEHDEIEVPIVFYRVGQSSQMVEPELQTAVPIEEPSILAAEETPSIYQEQGVEELSHTFTDEETIQPEDMANKDNSAEAYAESIAVDAVSYAYDEAEQEPLSAGKATLGIAPQPKAFGQMSNKLFSLEEDDANKAEKSA